MNKFINESKRQFTVDRVLTMLLIALALISFVSIYMARPLMNVHEAKTIVQKQIMWYSIGIVTVIALLKIGVERIFTFVDIMYWILMVFLVGLLVARFTHIFPKLMPQINGTYAWYIIPGIGSFQPSEFVKIVLCIKSANIIQEHNANKTEYSFRSDWQLFLKMAAWALPPFILIFLQPDTGVPIVILFSLATMFLISGVRKEWFFIVFGIAFGALFGIVFLYYNFPDILNSLLGGGATGYRLNRFNGWLDYEKYALTDGYQVFQALLSIGTAGLTGHRPFFQVIAHFPEAQTDFIFAVINQNFGFIGGCTVILTSFALYFKLAWNTLKSNLQKERYFMMGILGMLIFQGFQNMGMILSVLPITGITLPFISYGGSSLISYMVPIAVAYQMYSDTQNLHKH